MYLPAVNHSESFNKTLTSICYGNASWCNKLPVLPGVHRNRHPDQCAFLLQAEIQSCGSILRPAVFHVGRLRRNACKRFLGAWPGSSTFHFCLSPLAGTCHKATLDYRGGWEKRASRVPGESGKQVLMNTLQCLTLHTL